VREDPSHAGVRHRVPQSSQSEPAILHNENSEPRPPSSQLPSEAKLHVLVHAATEPALLEVSGKTPSSFPRYFSEFIHRGMEMQSVTTTRQSKAITFGVQFRVCVKWNQQKNADKSERASTTRRVEASAHSLRCTDSATALLDLALRLGLQRAARQGIAIGHWAATDKHRRWRSTGHSRVKRDHVWS
jgi:hypothetical protein